ncbi:MAG: hypothetical protein HY925_16060 [Elusimicrobia bacterium]|nr:hypothetical protein [Elusimicrobiota bacterium]
MSPLKKWLLIALGGLVVVPPLGLAAWAWLALHVTYASGERAGFVQKISRKGWVCKTWEGELAMASLPGAMPQIFAFTVRDHGVAREIEQEAGRKVALSYEQHRGLPGSCFGETEYFVTGVRRVVDDPPAPSPKR